MTYTYDRRTASSVGAVIVQQMGGSGRLRAMINADIREIPHGVWIKFPNRQRSKGNLVEIKLQPSDTYEVTFYNEGRMAERKRVKQIDDVYADQLVDVFERQTGLYLRL